MAVKVFRKEFKSRMEKYKKFSCNFIDLYLGKGNILIKNYVIDPDTKVID